MENEIVGWEDILDVELSKKRGEYLLYRNYKIRHDDGNESFVYSISGSKRESGLLNLFATMPIAKGLTAYLVKGNRSGQNLFDFMMSGRPLKIRDFYNSYELICSEQAEKVNESSINPLQQEDVIHDFLPAHILQEEKFLAESEKYFSEYLTEKERVYKALLKKGVCYCINWIHDSYRQLLQSNNCLSQSQFKRTSVSTYEELDDDREILADIILLRNMEELLKFIYQRFYEQVFYASRAFIAPLDGIPADPDVEYVYNIMLSSGIFNTRLFKDKITALMLCSDTNIKGLLTCIYSVHAISDEAALLFENYLLHKKCRQQITFNVSFRDYPGNYIIHKSIATPKGFIRFTNDDLYFFCNEISSFSISLVNNFKRISSGEDLPENTPPVVQDVTGPLSQLPNGILEYKINAALLPLTNADGISIPCISTEYKNYLVQAFVSIKKDGAVIPCKSVSQVRNNDHFFRVINEIKNAHKYSTREIIAIISGSTGKSLNTIRNNLSLYKVPE
ncbi:MAG: hypothetical protein WCI92_18320 [Bacteroidota bacterium]